MNFLKHISSPESILIRLFFSLTILFSLSSKLYDPSFFIGYVSGVLQIEGTLLITITVVFVALEAFIIFALFAFSKESWPFLLIVFLNTVLAISLIYATNLNLEETNGCFGAYIQFQAVNSTNIFYHLLLAVTSCLIWFQKD